MEKRRDLAWKAHREGDLQQAERHYRSLLDESPIEEDAVNLGAIWRQQGRLREAAELYRSWLPHFPNSLQLHLNAANCLHDLNEHAACVALMRRYLEHRPEVSEIERALARSLIELQHYGEAEQLLHTITFRNPDAVSAWMDLGLCLHRQNKEKEALQCFERVQAIDPEHSVAAANRITMLKDAGRFSDCEQLIADLPVKVRSNPGVRGAIALLQMAQNDAEAAAKELTELCNQDPQNSGHWLNLAANLRSLKHCNAALRVLKMGICRQPEETDLKQALGQCLAELGRTKQALPVLQQSAGPLDEIRDDYLFNLQFLGAGYHLIPPQDLKNWAQAWEKRKQQDSGLINLWADQIRPPIDRRRLRIGYLSADWSNHPVCRFMIPVLQQHDRSAVEVWGLCSSPHIDEGTTLARQSCDHWLELRHTSDIELARIVASHKLDVVVELGGYTGHSRISALLHQAAPVQLSYLGYFAPSYLKAIDGWIGDQELFAGLDALDRGAHQLWMVKGGYMAYEPSESLPILECKPRKHFRFGSFNHSRKLNPGTVALFAKVLAAVPESELVLKSISFVETAERERVIENLLKAGVREEQIVLLGATDRSNEHLSLYREMDVALDPFPYGGATTSCEALIMGVPVITLAGQGMAGRLTSSILASAGCQEWIAGNFSEYVELARNMASAGQRNQAQREQLRKKVQTSALGDGPRLCRELERIYQEAYRAKAII